MLLVSRENSLNLSRSICGEGASRVGDGGEGTRGHPGALLPRPSPHRDVLVVLAQLVGSGHHLPLRDPLLQVVHVAFELAEPLVLLERGPALLRQVLQAGVELVHLALAQRQPLAAGTAAVSSGGTGTGHPLAGDDVCRGGRWRGDAVLMG